MERPSQIFRSNSSSTVGAETSVHNYSPDHLVHDPLCSGFLLKHCKEQFSDENMLFIVAVDRFRDYFHRDHLAWPQIPWRKLDDEHITVSPETETMDDYLQGLEDPNFFPERTWPSSIVSRDAIRDVLLGIIKEFLVKDSPKWICISQAVLCNTMKRIRLLHIYGQEAFSEALFDPLRTIERDIYPRFQISVHYRRMLETKQMLEKKAYMEKFRLPKPERHIHNKYTKQQLQSGKLVFTLAELLEDGTLYEEFAKFVKAFVSEENVKCVRALAIYKDTFAVRDNCHASMDFAVLIYRYFVAPRAPCEICISHVHANEILRGLAEPYATLFDAVERSAMTALQAHYNSFRNTPQFSQLGKVVLANAKLPPVINTSVSGHSNTLNRGSGHLSTFTNSTGGSGGRGGLELPGGRTNSSSSIFGNNNAASRSRPGTMSSSSSAPAIGMSAIFGTCFPST